MDWNLFRAEGLSRALTAAGHDVSKRTVERWKAGESTPSKGHLEAIRRLVCGDDYRTQRSTPPGDQPDGAFDRFMDRWESGDPPAWAQGLADQILNAIDRDRKAFLEQAAAQYAEIAELLTGPDNGGAAPPGNPGPRPKRPGPQTGP